MITWKSLSIEFNQIKRLIYFEELSNEDTNACYAIRIETKDNTYDIVITESSKEVKTLIIVLQEILSVELVHMVNKGFLGIKEKPFKK